jgi:hypothetical protein
VEPGQAFRVEARQPVAARVELAPRRIAARISAGGHHQDVARFDTQALGVFGRLARPSANVMSVLRVAPSLRTASAGMPLYISPRTNM